MGVHRTVDRLRHAARHQEVEIEAKSGDGARILRKLTEDLKNIFPQDLVVWHHSKFAIGLAVEHLAESGDLKGLIDVHDNLKPEAYSRIDAYLRAATL